MESKTPKLSKEGKLRQERVEKRKKEKRMEILIDLVAKGRAIDAVFPNVKKELFLSLEKHPNWPVGNMYKQVAIITEEVGEVAQAVLKYHDEGGHHSLIRHELNQAAAMCLKMLLSLDESLKFMSHEG